VKYNRAQNPISRRSTPSALEKGDMGDWFQAFNANSGFPGRRRISCLSLCDRARSSTLFDLPWGKVRFQSRQKHR